MPKTSNDLSQLTRILTDFILYSQNQFKGIQAQFKGIQERFDWIDDELKSLNHEQKTTNIRLSSLEASVKKLDQKKEDSRNVDELEIRVETVEEDVVELKKTVFH